MKHTPIILVAAAFILTTSCKKEQQIQKVSVNPSLVYQSPSTPAEKELVANLSKVTEVFKELYRNDFNFKVVSAAVKARAYTDESVLLRDLIYPENSRLLSVKAFSHHEHVRAFAKNFWKQASKKNDDSFTGFLESLKPAINVRTSEQPAEVSIYYPYSEGFGDNEREGGGDDETEDVPDPNDHETGGLPIVTIVTATEDADEGIGYQPYQLYGETHYREVIVNDDYAAENPTHIIGLNGVEPYEIPAALNTAFPPGSPIDITALQREVSQVYIGDVRCKKQYDALISFTGNGGGSEIRFTRSDAYLKFADGQVQAETSYLAGDREIGRGDIRNRRFVNYSVEWDFDWEPDNLQQNLAIFEDDNRNESSFNGSLTTTASATLPPVTATVSRVFGFTINFKSDDHLIKQMNYNRDVFFILNRQDLEGEMYNGWPVRDRGANVSFTLNDRLYY
jgi:hypothetical protein